LWRSALPVVAALLVGGCGGSSPLRLTYADNGRVETLAVGGRAVVRLDQPEWGFLPVTGKAVRAEGDPRLVFVTKGCKMLPGCGYVSLTVKAVAPGRSVITAARGLCGELFRCPPAKRRFAVTVVVH
jgi:hypothetical protein